MKTIHQTYEMQASPQEVFDALVKPEIIEKWSGAPAEMEPTQGSLFRLWGGDIHGTNKEVIPGEKLVQDWYSGNWENPSTVTFILEPQGKNTMVHLEHNNVPEQSYNSINSGWKEYYLGPMQEMFAGS